MPAIADRDRPTAIHLGIEARATGREPGLDVALREGTLAGRHDLDQIPVRLAGKAQAACDVEDARLAHLGRDRVIGRVELGEGRRRATEERQALIGHDVLAERDAPALEITADVRIRSRIDHHEQRATPTEVARERRVFFVEQWSRRPRHHDGVRVFRDVRDRGQQQGRHFVGLVLERGARAAVAATRLTVLTLGGAFVVPADEVDLAPAAARQLHDRVRDRRLAELLHDVDGIAAGGDAHEARGRDPGPGRPARDEIGPHVRIRELERHPLAGVLVAPQEIAHLRAVERVEEAGDRDVGVEAREHLLRLVRECVDLILAPVEALRVARSDEGQHAEQCDAEDGTDHGAGAVLPAPASLRRRHPLAQRIEIDDGRDDEQNGADPEIAEDPGDVGRRLEERNDETQEPETEGDDAERAEQRCPTRHQRHLADSTAVFVSTRNTPIATP